MVIKQSLRILGERTEENSMFLFLLLFQLLNANKTLAQIRCLRISTISTCTTRNKKMEQIPPGPKMFPWASFEFQAT